MTTFLADWLWFGEVGYQPVFLHVARTRAGWSASRRFSSRCSGWPATSGTRCTRPSGAPASFTTREGFTIVLPTRDQLRPLAMLAAAAAAALVGTLRRVRVADGAGVVVPRRRSRASDPILGSNVAFYVFTLPLLELLRGARHRRWSCWPRSASAALYVFAGELALTPFGLRMVAERPPPRRGAGGGVLPAARARRLARSAAPARLRRRASSRAPATPTSTRGMPAALALAGAALVGAVLCRALRHRPRRARPGRGRRRSTRVVARRRRRSTPRRSSASSSRPTNRRARRRTSCTTSRRRGRASRSIASRSAS